MSPLLQVRISLGQNATTTALSRTAAKSKALPLPDTADSPATNEIPLLLLLNVDVAELLELPWAPGFILHAHKDKASTTTSVANWIFFTDFVSSSIPTKNRQKK